MLGCALCFASAAVIASSRLSTRRVLRVALCCAGVALAVCGVLCFVSAKRAGILAVRQEAYYRMMDICGGLADYERKFGRFPAVLDDLVDSGTLRHSYVLLIPGKNDATFPEHCYCYSSGLTKADPESWPLVFEPTDVNGDGGGMVCYVSGQIEWVSVAAIREKVARFREEFVESRGSEPLFVGECSVGGGMGEHP